MNKLVFRYRKTSKRMSNVIEKSGKKTVMIEQEDSSFVQGYYQKINPKLSDYFSVIPAF